MTLGDLRRAAELLPEGSAVTLSREALLAALQTVTDARIAEPIEEAPEHWLTAHECAARLHVSARWCYDHAKQLGAKRLSRRCIRFSSHAVERYMARRS